MDWSFLIAVCLFIGICIIFLMVNSHNLKERTITAQEAANRIRQEASERQQRLVELHEHQLRTLQEIANLQREGISLLHQMSGALSHSDV